MASSTASAGSRTLLVGYGLGGLLLTAVSPRHALLITVGTFLASATLLRCRTRHRPARTRRDTDTPPGPRRLLADRRVRVLLLAFWLPAAFSVVPEAPAAPYADELFAGAGLGPKARERVALPLLCLTLLPYLGYALRPGLTASLLLVLLSGAGSAYILGLDQWFVRAVPEELRGRPMTVLSAGLMTVQGVGMAPAGVVAQTAGVRTAVAGAGVAGVLCCCGPAAAARATEEGPGGGQETESRDRAARNMTGR
ncbi:hypothetical protein ACWGLF_10500 [Streptomyces puniciscabiei]